MNNYTIAKQVTINAGIQLFLLNISKNIRYCNRSIIPKDQIDDISRYKLKQDSDKRLLARSFLYEYLRRYDGMEDFELDFNEYKKPFLKAAPAINFSFSYAKDYLLVGISGYKKVGIDIEHIDPALKISEIAPEIMCPAELQQFNSYAGNSLNQYIYFYNLFSAKESIIKSFGTGLHFDVKNLNILDNAEYSYLDAKFIYQGLGLWMNKYTLAICYEK
ncbi:MAG: 4'-phosphopantetheinyl transferase superfamily protein [Ferruginibacter sp.]